MPVLTDEEFGVASEQPKAFLSDEEFGVAPKKFLNDSEFGIAGQFPELPPQPKATAQEESIGARPPVLFPPTGALPIDLGEAAKRLALSLAGRKVFGATEPERAAQRELGTGEPSPADVLSQSAMFAMGGGLLRGIPAGVAGAKMVYDSIVALPDQFSELKDAVKAGDSVRARRAGMELGMNAAMLAAIPLAAKFGGEISKGQIPEPETIKPPEVQNAGQIQPATEVGVRSEGGGLGESTPLRQPGQAAEVQPPVEEIARPAADVSGNAPPAPNEPPAEVATNAQALPTESETITATAVRNPATGKIASGKTIHVLLYPEVGLDPTKMTARQVDQSSGYLTSTGRFVNQEEGQTIAERAKQIPKQESLSGEIVQSLPEIAAASDFARYNELVAQMATQPTPEAWAELEAIKNRNGGQPPSPPAQPGVGIEETKPSGATTSVEQGAPPASIKQPDPISESSPPAQKIDATAEFSPPTTETPPANLGPGMGGAKLGEVSVEGNPDIYGVAERVREERAKAGQVDPVSPGVGIAAADSVEHGRELLRSGRSAQGTLDLFEKTKAVSADDMAVVRAHGEELALAARRIEEQRGTDSTEYKAARDALSEWDRRSKAMQTEWHKIGQAQQGETDIDTGSFTGLAREFKSQTGKDFTPGQERTAKKKAGQKKKADAEAATAKETLFNHLDETTDATAAEKRAKAAADRTVRENAVRLADAETKTRVAQTVAERAAARIQEDASRKALKDSQEAAKTAAVKLAKAETDARLKETTRPEAVQAKAAQDALDSANETVRNAAKKLADEETKARVAKTDKETQAAKVAIKRARQQLKDSQERVRKAAIKSADAENKLRVARADKPTFVWSKAREYIERGITNFDEIRHKLAVDLGMSVDEVTRALGATKRAKGLTNELWRKQQAARRLDQQAKQWLRDVSIPAYRRYINNVPKILFGLKVGFHGTVALGTHAPMVAFQPKFWKTYVENFGRMYRMVGSSAFYEMKVQDLLRDKNYITARRAGLVNDPFHFEDFNSPDIAKYMAKMTAMGNRGYAVLKMLRQDMFNQHWDNLPRSLRQPELAEAIADAVNHATGVVKVNAPKGTSVALFAPRLEMSRVAWLLADPAIAMKSAIEWKTATRAEKYFAVQQFKEKAWVAGTLYGLLALNQGILSLTDSKQKINGLPEFDGGAGFDPMRGDFMKFKAAGMQLSYGNAMLTMARLPVRLYQIRTSDGGKLKNLVHPDENSYTVLGEYARSQLSPFASLATSLWFKADWQNRPLPNSNRKVPKRLAAQGVQPYTWPEFWAEQALPIPFEEAAREVWHSGLGMSDQQVAQMRKAMATIAIMGATGARLSDDWTMGQPLR